jgi:hypothetical protein
MAKDTMEDLKKGDYFYKSKTKPKKPKKETTFGKIKKFVRDNEAKIEAGALGALILGGTMAKAKLLSGQSKKDYYSKKKYADPRKVQRPDNFNF